MLEEGEEQVVHGSELDQEQYVGLAAVPGNPETVRIANTVACSREAVILSTKNIERNYTKDSPTFYHNYPL